MDHDCSELDAHVYSNTKTYARLFANAAVEILAEKNSSMVPTNSNSFSEEQVEFFLKFQIPPYFFNRIGKKPHHIEYHIHS
jgi:hypothetical protein